MTKYLYRRLILGFTLIFITSTSIFIFQTQPSFAWGARGHDTIGSVAARKIEIELQTSKDPAEKHLASFFGENRLAAAYLSNIPDTGWRSVLVDPLVQKLNAPTHFLNGEFLIGAPGPDFQNELKALPGIYSDLLQYNGKKSPLTGEVINVFNAGVAPWRVEQLFNLGVSALECLKQKESSNSTVDLQKPFVYAIASPKKDPIETMDDIPKAAYTCDADLGPAQYRNRYSEITAAFIFLGVMAHFIEDLTQPFHSSANYDGWMNGQGGIHSYFETDVVQALDESLMGDVLKNAEDELFLKKLWTRLNFDPLNMPENFKTSGAVSKLMLAVGADAVIQMPNLLDIDSKIAVTKKGDAFPWGVTESAQSKGKRAQRIPASDPKVVAAFKSIIEERLATGAAVLSAVWLAAWKMSGSPDLSTFNPVTHRNFYLPYPHNPPFIFPYFDSGAIAQAVAEIGAKKK